MNDHRRFLKSFSTNNVGDFFPNQLTLDIEGNTIDTSEISDSPCGYFVFLAGTNCDACNFSVIEEFINKYQKFNYLMLLQGSIEKVNINMDIYSCSMRLISNQLNGNGLIPSVLVINPKGQIVANGIFNSLDILEAIAWPLLHVYNDKKED
ncbi:hypothetical protein [Lysinibacillus fusiformis]|uniref:Thioredoxin domain-containing protein n=1 Tax=Lysinibacillus fusiformis TaxID=28031 RepID=A0A1E4R9S2_9BACI|nr:hypothetical protein [Lysinibacillus fusiformis]ODV57225.1 hypothetical protein BG258_15575 [Lysinibacillus fusiformis]